MRVWCWRSLRKKGRVWGIRDKMYIIFKRHTSKVCNREVALSNFYDCLLSIEKLQTVNRASKKRLPRFLSVNFYPICIALNRVINIVIWKSGDCKLCKAVRNVQDLKLRKLRKKKNNGFPPLDPKKKRTCGSSIAHIIRVLPPAHI